MAHERTELELGPGINALTGPNNTGKSAIVEALRCVTSNPVPKHYIRHGAKEARVTVEVEDGTRVIWIRKKRSSGYEIWAPGAEEAQEYWKFGRKPPEDVLNALRMDLVDLEGDKDPIDVHIGNQRDPVFLLNQPKSDAAAFFAASTESAHLLGMQNLLKRKTQEAKRSEKRLLERMKVVEEELDLFSSLPAIDLELEKAQELEATAKKCQASIPALENMLETRKIIDAALRDQTTISAVLSKVESIPTICNTDELNGLCHQITIITTGLGQATERVASLSTLQPMPATENTGRLAHLCEELQSVEQVLAISSKRGGATADLSEPPVLSELSQLSEIINELLASGVRARREEGRKITLEKVLAPPELQNLDHLQGVIAALSTSLSEATTAQKAFHRLEIELQTLEMTIQARLNELGHCPTCGSELKGLELLDRGGRNES